MDKNKQKNRNENKSKKTDREETIIKDIRKEKNRYTGEDGERYEDGPSGRDKKKDRKKDKGKNRDKKKKKDRHKEKHREKNKEKSVKKESHVYTGEERQLLEERKQMIYSFVCDELYVPMKTKEMASILQVPKSQRDQLQEVLDVLVAECKIEVSKKGKYSRSRGDILFGTFISNARGFGFVTVEGEEEDYFIAAENRGGAVHMDQVQIRPVTGQTGRRREAEIVKIVARGFSRIVGTYESSKTFGFVIPDNHKFGRDIFVLKEHSLGAVAGHKVVVQLTSYGEKDKKPEGKIIEIIGHINDPGTDILSIVKDHELPLEFPEKVLRQAANVSNEVSEADRMGRLDLRDWQMVTIDGEDAKDLDDAVSCVKEGDNYRLGVHIADVSNYVQERSALDVEALKRGTSVYLVDRVIPMLPHRLSNGICSLNAGEDRLALSCIMLISPKGQVIDHQIAETVINVDRRMTYTAVRAILEDHDEALCQEYGQLVPMFERMKELAALLRQKRMIRGSIDFDFPETKIILDDAGKPLEIKPYERNVATKLIEDFMLIANETVAQDYFWQEMPFVYRSHETPDTERIKKLAAFISSFGLTLHHPGEEIHPKELQKLLARIDGTPQEALISRLTLRSMRQAKYTVDCLGHFGLATGFYCHFTSPIRRYPDLQIHRIIKDNLRGRMSEKKKQHYEAILPQVAKHSSETERRADEAERDTDKLKKAEYMQEHIGEEFEGVISSITSWGMYVELPDTIEGMVHVSSMADDHYHYVEATHEMTGERSGKSYRLGQFVRVVCTGADKFTRTIDFALAEDEESGDE